MGLFESHVPVESITVMVQKEVADRMHAGNERLRCIISGSAVLCKTLYCCQCSAELFYAETESGSGVIRLTRHAETPVQVDDEKLLFQIIRASFNQKKRNAGKRSEEL